MDSCCNIGELASLFHKSHIKYMFKFMNEIIKSGTALNITSFFSNHVLLVCGYVPRKKRSLQLNNCNSSPAYESAHRTDALLTVRCWSGSLWTSLSAWGSFQALQLFTPQTSWSLTPGVTFGHEDVEKITNLTDLMTSVQKKIYIYIYIYI